MKPRVFCAVASASWPSRNFVSRIICVSYSGDLAKKHANDFRAVLESPWYRSAFPNTRIGESPRLKLCSVEKLYSNEGRPSIPPEQLLSTLLLQVFYGIRSERQLMEQLDYNLLYRWFAGLAPDDHVWDTTTFTKNRDRLPHGEVFQKFMTKRSRVNPAGRHRASCSPSVQ